MKKKNTHSDNDIIFYIIERIILDNKDFHT